MIRIGLIGAGRIGTLHARNIAASREGEIVAVADDHAPAARALADVAGGVVAAGAEEVLGRDDVDAVFICSPTDTHVALIRAAAAAGKAIFCEKPIDIDMHAAASVLATLAAHPVPFMVGFHRRFDPTTRRIARHVADGGIGRAEFMRVMSRDPGPPPIAYIARSGGIYRDMTIHDLDLCRWISGREFTSVYARGFVHVDDGIAAAGDVDTAFVTLVADDGFHVVIQNSRRTGGGFDQRIEVMGSAGAVAVDNVPSTAARFTGPEGTAGDRLPNHFPERYAAAYVAELGEFLAAVREGRAPSTTALDGVAALELADACAASAATGAPVSVRPIALSSPEVAAAE